MSESSKLDNLQSISEEYIGVKWEEIDLVKFLSVSTIVYTLENLIHYPFWYIKTIQQLNREKVFRKTLEIFN